MRRAMGWGGAETGWDGAGWGGADPQPQARPRLWFVRLQAYCERQQHLPYQAAINQVSRIGLNALEEAYPTRLNIRRADILRGVSCGRTVDFLLL